MPQNRGEDMRRIFKTPRRRLLSEGVFEWMMEKRRAKDTEQRSTRQIKVKVPGSQTLMSKFFSLREKK